MPINSEERFTVVKVLHDVSRQRVMDLIITAFEGGSNYWIDVVDAGKREDWPAGIDSMYELVAAGYPIKIYHDEESGEQECAELTHVGIVSGFNVLSDQYPKVMQRILDESYDADDADVWLQCACFAEVVYG